MFSINVRGSKRFDTGKGTSSELFVDVFNILNRTNHSIFVDIRQLTASGRPNPDYGSPTGSTMTRPRTAQVGLRFSF